MTQRLIISLLFLVVSCKTKTAEWQTLDFDDFKLKAPKDWTKFKEQGIDAYVGGLTNGKDSLWFYFGSYVSGFQGDNENYLFVQDVINGKVAAIKIPKKDSVGSIQMFMDNVEGETKFVLSSSYTNKTDLILDILKSVTFKSSDTTRNGTLTFNKFKKYPSGSGSTIYQSTCTACHSRYKIFVGPALTPELLNSRTKEWLYTFFKERQNLKKDSAYTARKKEFNDVDCIQLPDDSKEDVELLVSYLKGQ